MNKIFLFPGKIFSSSEPTEVTTILGSCVAVAIYDAVAKVAGINHYLLPRLSGDNNENARYGVFAIPELVSELEELGGERHRFKAKVFGGGSVLGDVSSDMEVGNKNIIVAKELLAQLNIPIVEENTGGFKGRRIIFNTSNFSVQHRLTGEQGKSVDVSGFEKIAPINRCKVLIIDDSATVRNLFQNIFTKNGLVVVGAAANAFEAREMLVKHRPDVMTLDIEMPNMSGVQFLEKVMKHMPTPAVMVSSLGSQGEAALRSLELGAIEFVQKPSQFDLGQLQDLAQELVAKVRAAASTNVIALSQRKAADAALMPHVNKKITNSGFKEIQVIGVSGNSGSQQSLETFLLSLPADTPPVLVANSTVTLFLSNYLQKLSKASTQLSFHQAEDQMPLKRGHIYFAPAGKHFGIAFRGKVLTAVLSDGHAVHSQIPSGNHLFESLAEVAPATSMGILLSGFGLDGVDGLEKLQSVKSITMAEDPTDLKFPFTPQAAIARGVADHISKVSDFSQVILEQRNKVAA